MTTLDDFFAPSYDAVEERALCLECQEKCSNEAPGHWVAKGTLWVCEECMPEWQAHQAEKEMPDGPKPAYGDEDGTGWMDSE